MYSSTTNEPFSIPPYVFLSTGMGMERAWGKWRVASAGGKSRGLGHGTRVEGNGAEQGHGERVRDTGTEKRARGEPDRQTGLIYRQTYKSDRSSYVSDRCMVLIIMKIFIF